MDLLENIVYSVPKNRALLGLDVGKKTIGVAVCDPDLCLATPITTIKRTKFRHDIMALEKIIREYEVGGFIIGYPLHMDGKEGRKCQSIRDFADEFSRQLSGEFKCGGAPWVAFWDERLSTSSVEYFVHETVDMSRRKAKEKGLIDKLAAQIILQGAIDYMVSHNA